MFYIFFFCLLYFLNVCVAHRCTCVSMNMPQLMYRQRTTCGSRFSPSTIWLLVIEIRSAKSIYLLSLSQCMLSRFIPTNGSSCSAYMFTAITISLIRVHHNTLSYCGRMLIGIPWIKNLLFCLLISVLKYSSGIYWMPAFYLNY